MTVSLLSGHALSDDKVRCPQVLSTIDKGVLSLSIGRTVSKLYQELGCPVRMEALPGRRGITHFNNHLVDGELIRLEKAETSYTRAFVRSGVPLYVLTSSLWHHPDGDKINRLPIGYTLGILWQEEYMKGNRGRRFSNVEELFFAYNSGQLAGFLSNDMAVLSGVDASKVTPRPVKVKTILTLPLYHYLGREFTPFMEKLSDLVAAQGPVPHSSATH